MKKLIGSKRIVLFAMFFLLLSSKSYAIDIYGTLSDIIDYFKTDDLIFLLIVIVWLISSILKLIKIWLEDL